MAKSYLINGQNYAFSSQKFRQSVREVMMNRGWTRDQVYDFVGKRLNCSPDTVSNWYKGKNAPIDYNFLHQLCDLLLLSDAQLLDLIEVKEKSMAKKYRISDEMAVAAMKRVTDAIYDFLNEYEDTDGFNGLYNEGFARNSNPVDLLVAAKSPQSIASQTRSFARERFLALKRVVEKENVLLQGTEFREKLNAYLYGDDGLVKVELYDEEDGFGVRYGVDQNGFYNEDIVQSREHFSEKLNNLVCEFISH